MRSDLSLREQLIRSAEWVVETCGRRDVAGLTVKRLTRAARALVATAARRAACLHLKCAVRGGVPPLRYR